MNRRIRVLVMLVVLGWHTSALAIDAATQQHIQELQAQIDALEVQAQQYRNAIATQQDKAASLQRDIAIVQGQIGQLQAQINANTAKINLTDLQINNTEGKISQIQASIDQKRATIGRMILFLEQRDHEDLVASLFKYQNLSGFLQQFHDMATVQDQLVATVSDLEQSQIDLEESREELQDQQTQLQELNDQVASQQQQIVNVKNQKSKLLKDTKGQEAIYQKQLTATEKKQAAFFQEQQKLESQIVAGGLYIVHVTAGSVPPRGTKLFSLPEDRPYITQGYGMTAYAKRGAYGGQAHSGIDYASGYGTPIKAIGPGTLIAHGTNDGWGNWIAIQHPNNMVSLYGHMSRFEYTLSVGSPVSQGQVIGYEGNTGNVTGSHVHLSLYKDFFTYISDKNGQLYFNYWDGTLNPADYVH